MTLVIWDSLLPPSYARTPELSVPPPPPPTPEAEFLDVIGTNVLRVSSLLFTVNSTNGFYSPPPRPPWVKIFWNWFVMLTLYSETSSLETLKIMPRNLNEIGSHEFCFREGFPCDKVYAWELERRQSKKGLTCKTVQRYCGKFSSYIRKSRMEWAKKSDMRKGFLFNKEMSDRFVIHEAVVAYIWIFT